MHAHLKGRWACHSNVSYILKLRCQSSLCFVHANRDETIPDPIHAYKLVLEVGSAHNNTSPSIMAT